MTTATTARRRRGGGATPVIFLSFRRVARVESAGLPELNQTRSGWL